MGKIKAIIAAGGKGTRLRPLTFTSNKHLLPIANKPLLLYSIENIASCGIKEVGIITNKESKEAIENLLGDGTKWGLKITYIIQNSPLGVAHVIKISKKFLGKSPFIYHLGDNIFTAGIEKPYRHFQKTKPDAMLTILEHKENYRLGVPFFKNGKIVKVVEKPKNPPNKFGIPGLYFFTHRVFAAFSGKEAIKPSARGELEIADVFNYLLTHGFRVEQCKIDGQWLDPGKFDDSLEANRILLELNCQYEINGEVDTNSKLTGRLSIGKGTKIKNSQIFGPTSIADDAYIEDSFIGPYTSIATGCKIVGSTVKNSIIMEKVNIVDCPVQIVSSMIGKNSNICVSQTTNPSCKLTISDMSIIEFPK